jgi:uncharacterized protein YhaN
VRIKEVHIDGYGLYHNFHLHQDQFSAPITMFYGQNEAGKSTLHSFIRSLLFGFQLKGLPTYEAINGGQLGGLLTVEDEEGHIYRIERKSPPKRGKTRIYLEDGQEAGENVLKQLLGNISAPLYTNIFAFSHRELQRIDTLQGEEISAYLYSAAMGTGTANLIDIEKTLNKTKEELFKPRATNPEINKLLQELEESKKEIDQLGKQIEEYAPLKKEMGWQKDQLLHIRRHREELERQRFWFNTVQKGYQLKHSLQALHIQLEELSEPAQRFLSYEAEFQDVQMERAVIQEKEREKLRVDEQISQTQQKIADNLQALGRDWSIEHVKEIEVSIPIKDQLVQLAQQKKTLYEQASTLSQNWKEKQREVERLYGLCQQEKQKQLEQETEVMGGRDQTAVYGSKKKRQKRTVLVLSAMAALILPLLLLGLEQAWAAGILFISLLLFTIQKYQKDQHISDVYRQELAKIELAMNRMNEEAQYKTKQLQQEYEMAKQLLKQLERDKLEKETELGQVIDRYNQALSRNALPLELSPEGLAELWRKIEDVRDESTHLEHLEGKREELHQYIADWSKQVTDLAQKCQIETTSHNLSSLIDLFHRQLKKEAEVEQQKRELNIECKQLEAQLLSLVQGDEQKKEQLDLAIKKWDEQYIQQEIIRTEEQYQEVLHEIEVHATKIGELESKLKELENEERLSLMQQEYQEKQAKFQELAKTWSIQALASYMCTKTRKLYEEERQPSVLTAASQYIRKMTEDRYKQIIVPMGQQELVVLREDGERLNSTQLSQGTKEQLYLAMRFAMVEEYAKFASLPIIIDDIFVNFDSDRLSRALQGLAHLSQTHQIILFTCHEHVVRQVQEVFKDTNLIDLSRESIS